MYLLPGHDPRVGHIPAHVEGEGTGDGVGRVDPAVKVEHIVRYILANIKSWKSWRDELIMR